MIPTAWFLAPLWRRLHCAEMLLLVTVTAWSLNATAMKYTLDHGLTPVQLSAIRWLAAALIFSGIAWRRYGRRAFAFPHHVVKRVVPLGIIAIWLTQLAFSYGVEWAGASTSSLVFGTLPVFAAVYSSLGGYQRLTRGSLAAIVLSLAGVAALATGGDATGTPDVGLGSALMLFAAAAFALYSAAAVPLMSELSPLQVNTAVTAVGGALLGLTGAPALVSANWHAVTPRAWLSLSFCVIVATVGGNLLWLLSVDRLGPTHAALYVNLQPFLGVLFGVVILSDRLNAIDAVGGAAIGFALIVGRRELSAARARGWSAHPGTHATELAADDSPGDVQRMER